MNELDENGWGHVHHAAFRGFVKSVERFVNAHADQLELRTGDGLESTPLLLAAMSDHLDTVTRLLDLGADIGARNAQGDGLVELCAFKQHIAILEHLLERAHDRLPVWTHLVRFMTSETEDEAEAAAGSIRVLTECHGGELNPKWRAAFVSGVAVTAVEVVKGEAGGGAKAEAMRVLLNLVPAAEARQQAVGCGCLPALVRHLKPETAGLPLIELSARLLTHICVDDRYADDAVQTGAVPALARVLTAVSDPGVLTVVVEALSCIAADRPTHQDTMGSTGGLIASVVALLDGCGEPGLQLVLLLAVAQFAKLHPANQTLLVDAGVATGVIALTRGTQRDLQLAAVDAIYRLGEGNPAAARALLHARAVPALLPLLKRGRPQALQESAAGAVWALAGDDVDEQHGVAEAIGVAQLVEFTNSLSDRLHYIGCECLGGLAQGPVGRQTAVAAAGGVPPLVRLLRSDKEHIVLSATRTLRHLCVGVGYVPHALNQASVATHRGIRLLVALMAYSSNDLIQAEAAYTLGCLALGNNENLAAMHENIDFNLMSIMQWMYSKNDAVRVLAGSALAALAYNNLNNQRDIIDHGHLLFACFEGFLDSKDELHRCLAAFQVVVLAQIIMDEEQAVSSAAGIKILVDLLTDHRSIQTLALAADCIARLAHTRAGVPAAFVAIDAVQLLSNLLRHTTGNVRGCAAIALGYLSYNHVARRQMLNRCRKDPHLMNVLTHYTANRRLAPDFLEGWKHYQQIGLPPVAASRAESVSSERALFSGPELGRQATDTSLDEPPEDSTTATNVQVTIRAPSGRTTDDRSTTDDSTMTDDARSSQMSTAMSIRSVDAPSSAGQLIESA